MKLMKLLLLLPLFFLLVLSSACEQPEDEPGPGPGGGFVRCIQVESTEEIPQLSYFTYQYCDGCCWRGGESFNQFPFPISSTKFFKPGSFCYNNLDAPNLPHGEPCSPQHDDSGCSNCRGGSTSTLTRQTRAALLGKYPDLEWAIDQGFFVEEGK
jgi:hypothetical protein